MWGELIFDIVTGAFCYLGAFFHWAVFWGRKPFSNVVESELINGLIGFVMAVVLFFVFKNYVLELILYFINKRLHHN